MAKKVFLFYIFCLSHSPSLFAQVKDIVYFDSNGRVIIKEFATYYRVATYDTLSGRIQGVFQDFLLENDSLIARGEARYPLEELFNIGNFDGDPAHYNIAIEMASLKASYFRRKDYPNLGKVIKPALSLEERTGGENKVFRIVETLPEFPGGMEMLGWFIENLLVYPNEAKENNITGTVRIRFTVDGNGSVQNVGVIEGLGYGCDEEAIRVMQLISDWFPGVQHGTPVKVDIALKILFE